MLSVTIATVFGCLPEAVSASFMICGSACVPATRRGRSLEHVFEAAIGDQVGVGEGQHRQVGALGDLGHRERNDDR